ALANVFPRRLPADQRAQDARRIVAYVGSYTGAVGNGGNGEGIYSFGMDTVTGELTNSKLAAESRNPSWIAIHPSKRFLYAVNEVADGGITAFAIEEGHGELRELNQERSMGTGPAYMTLDRKGRFAFVANYGDGTVAVLPVREDGSLGSAVGVKRDRGFVGATRATDGPPGSFAFSGHDGPHAHMITPDPENRFVLATDLGQDRIYSYRFDAATGKLCPPSSHPFVKLPEGDGPRHLAFHPNGKWLYSIQEEASTVALFQYDSSSGALTAEQSVSTLPPGFAGTSFASEILIAPNGRFLYAANRLHDTIAAFAIQAGGKLARIGETPTMGDYPSQCAIDPSGRFLYACNRHSDSITCFRIDSPAGLPVFTGRYTPIGSAACIAFWTATSL
ncbi:MAG: lactonase family protein, partial [Terracidiphilus sp.]